MSIEFVKGNLLDSDCSYICHQVNCQGVMGAGVAKQISDKWPQVFVSYYEKCKVIASYNQPARINLGNIQIVALYDDFYATNSHQFVINMFAQEYYGNQGRFTSYDAFWECLWNIYVNCQKGSTIAFPKGIGCGLGGANWNIIYSMIEEVLGDEFKIKIYYLED